MPSLTGAIIDGQYTKNDASTQATAGMGNINTSKGNAATGTEYNQEMFLELLVAEMQYQDPLEPTSNTEYVAELASFTQIEAIQGVQDQMLNLEANSLVGKYVIMVDDQGEYVSGKVDYVVNDGGELLLAIEDKLYNIDQLDSVIDEAYYNTILTVEAFTDVVKKLPEVSGVTLSDASAIEYARAMYDAMDTYTKGYVPGNALSTLVSLETRIAALKKQAEAASDTGEKSEDKTEEPTEEVATEEVATA